MLMRPVRRARTPFGVDVTAGAVLVVAAALVAALVPAADGAARLAVLAVAVGLFAAGTVDAVAVAAVTLLAGLVDNGFLVDRFGQLGWHGWPDAYRIAALVLAGALGWSVGAAAGRVRRARARWRFDARWYQLLASAGGGEGDTEEGEEKRDG